MKDRIVIALVALGVGYLLFRGTAKIQPPRIVTQYDTVKVIDTQWVTKLKHDTVYKVNIVEKVTTSKPETVYVKSHPDTVSGILAVSVPKKVGDSTLVLGVKYIFQDSTLTHTHWQYQYWTPGPLRSLVVQPSGALSADFYNAPRACHEVRAAGVGAGAVTLLRLILGR
jgi:hypothetical protein